MIYITGNTANAKRKILKNKEEREFTIETYPTMGIIFNLVSRTRVERIYLTQGRFNSIQKLGHALLKREGVQLVVAPNRSGRPQKYDREVIKKDMKDLSINRFMEKYQMPRRTYYHIKKEMGF